MRPSAPRKGLYGFPKQLYHDRNHKNRSFSGSRKPIRWTLLVTAFMILTGFLRVNAAVGEEQITLSLKNAPLQKVFEELKRQTGYHFVYRDEVLRRARKVDVQVTRAMLRDVLTMVFKDQPLTYTIVDRIIVIRTKETEPVLIAQTSNVTDDGVFNVRGQVLNEKNEPVPGASVIVKNTKKTTVSNDKGEFSLNEIEENTVLVVSSVGYQTREMLVKAGGNVNVYLKRVINNLDEAVVVAYNTTTQRANTGAVTVVKGEQIATLPNRSFDKSLQGLVPGLLVTSGNGQPGSPPSNFVLRGIATGGQPINGETYRNPLIVVDGVPVSQEPPGYASNGTTFTERITNPLAQLNPSDIESISVLKDASAVALYGSKASNGVLLVTTKKGKAGRTVFSFRHQTDIASALEGKIKMLTQQEYLELLFEAYRNSNPVLYATDEAILADLRSKFPTIVKAPGDTSFYPQSDWTSALLNKSAVTISNEISMSGGNANSNFYMNLEYTKQNGVVRKTGYDRKSIRFNYEHRPTTWLKLGINSALSYNIQDYSRGEINFLGTLAMSPLNPIRDINDNYIYNYSWGLGLNRGFKAGNPVAKTELDINTSTAYRGLSRLFGEVKFLRNLSFSSSFGFNFMLNEAKQKAHPLVSGASTGEISEQVFRTTDIINTNLLQYNNLWNKTHSLNILAGQEAQVMAGKYSFISITDLSANPNQDQLQGNVGYAQGNTTKQTLLSYFGQVNYGFREKYYLSGSVRSDGSSRFGKNNRFGTYWSVGAGWVVSAESFMQKTNSWLSFLKLRGSMGPAGNSAAITDRLRFDPLFITSHINGTAVFYSPDENPGNPGIQWEQTFTWDAGLELRLLKDRISITADIYNRKTKNLIAYNINSALATGYATLTGNVGDIKNHGIELSLSARLIQGKDFGWNITANWSRNQNKLTRSFFPSSTVTGTNLVNEVGYEYNSFYLREWAGVNPENGRPMWIDSTTGKPTEDYSLAKPKIVGKSQPDGFGSINNTFSYKGFGLSISIYYQYGSQIYLNSNLQNDGNGDLDPYLNQTRNALDRWQKPGDIASNPRRLLNGMALDASGRTVVDQGASHSTRYLYDGDFIRLANVGLSYDFPKRLIERLHLSAARIFVQGNNLATWTKYSGQDPENVGPSGFGSILYPQSRSYSIGLNINF